MLAVVLATAAGFTACGVITKARPVRWLARTLVSDPVLAAFRREVVDVVREEVPAAVDAVLRKHPLTNGWGTASMQAIGDATGADMPPLHHPPEQPGQDDEP